MRAAHAKVAAPIDITRYAPRPHCPHRNIEALRSAADGYRSPARLYVQEELDRGRGWMRSWADPARTGRSSRQREPRDQGVQNDPVCAASVGPEENIAQRIAKPVSNPALRQVVAAVMDHVAALAKASQIAKPIVCWVIVDMRGSQDHAGRAHLNGFHERGPAG